MKCFRFISAEKAAHPLTLLCRVLRVSRSGYYAWRCRPPSHRVQADAVLTTQIRQIHATSRGTYGSPRVQAALQATGVPCARKRVARLMRVAGLAGCQRRQRRPRTTRADPTAVPAPDRVQRGFAPAQVGAPDRLWVSDITYVATEEGWLYLATTLDVFSRRVVGWAMAPHLRTELALTALAMAVGNRRPGADGSLVHHSDQGCQYTACAFGQRLQQAGLVASMGSVGDCYDNAVAESFFATLKGELLHRRSWPTRAAAQRAIFEYIEVWYNRQRRHSTLGYLSPQEYEQTAARHTMVA